MSLISEFTFPYGRNILVESLSKTYASQKNSEVEAECYEHGLKYMETTLASIDNYICYNTFSPWKQWLYI